MNASQFLNIMKGSDPYVFMEWFNRQTEDPFSEFAFVSIRRTEEISDFVSRNIPFATLVENIQNPQSSYSDDLDFVLVADEFFVSFNTTEEVIDHCPDFWEDFVEGLEGDLKDHAKTLLNLPAEKEMKLRNYRFEYNGKTIYEGWFDKLPETFDSRAKTPGVVSFAQGISVGICQFRSKAEIRIYDITDGTPQLVRVQH